MILVRDMGASASINVLALAPISLTKIINGDYAAASDLSDELIRLAEEKGSTFWKCAGMLRRATVLASTGKASDAIDLFAHAIPAMRSTGTTIYLPLWLSHFARACGELGDFDGARRNIEEAMIVLEATKEEWFEPELHRIAGEIAVALPKPDVAKANAHFERALAIARAQQAKSWELRSAISMAGLWRNQGKRDEARQLLTPILTWFTEGFDTYDLKQANALLAELA